MLVRLSSLIATVLIITLTGCGDGAAPYPTRNVSTTAAGDIELGRTLVDTGAQFARAGRFDSALVYFDRARTQFETAGAWPDLVRSYALMGKSAREMGRLELAASHLGEAIELARQYLDTADPILGTVHNYLGRLAIDRGDYPTAFDELDRALRIRTAAFGEDHALTAETHHDLGIAYRTTGEYRKAEIHYETALRIRQENSDEHRAELAETLTGLGILYTDQGEYERALDTLQKALQINTSLFGVSHPAVALSLYALGDVYWLQGAYKRALDVLQESLDLRLGLYGERHHDVAVSLGQKANVHLMMGEYDQAIESYERALRIFRDLHGERHRSVAIIYGNAAVVYRRIGDHQRAIEMLQSAVRIKESVLGADNPLMPAIHSTLGSIYYDTGEYARARNHHSRALEVLIAAHGETHPYVAAQYNELGTVAEKIGAPEQALSYYRTALRIFDATSGGTDPFVANTYEGLGSTYEMLGDRDRALEHHRAALHLRTNLYGSRHPVVAKSHNLLGDLHRKRGEWDLALASYERALDANASLDVEQQSTVKPPDEKILSESEWINSLRGRAQMLAIRASATPDSIADLRSAVQSYVDAARSIDRMRRSFLAEDSRLYWAEVAAPLYADAVKTAVRLYRATNESEHKSTAFQFAERSKAGVLREAFSEIRARHVAGIPDSLLREERTISVRLASMEDVVGKLRDGSVETGDLHRREGELFALKRQRDALIAHLEQTYPDYYALKYNVDVATPDNVREEALDSQTALIEYVLGEREIFILALTSTHFDVHAVPNDESLPWRIAEMKRGIVEQEFDRYTMHAHALYRQLLEPVLTKLDVKTLLLVPDGPLNQLPFEALLTSSEGRGSEVKDYRDLPFLIRRYAVSYAYSATLLLETQRRRRTLPDRDFVGFAPVFADAPSEGTTQMSEMDSSRDQLQPALSYLPSTREEVTRIRAAFADRYGFFERIFGRSAQVYLGDDAHERTLKTSALDRYRYVHFATHGFANETNKESSGILLYPEASDKAAGRGNTGENAEDGILRLAEIYSLRLNADLVTLSACETGLGPVVRGEGILSLTRGFLYAGASSVLVSLWKADDAKTAELMLAFYSRIIDGAGKLEALRAAKLELIREDPRYARPYYWAPFILVGR